jgi:Na+-transporting NADH:ubiquinone oxidoreductase subunit NqrB
MRAGLITVALLVAAAAAKKNKAVKEPEPEPSVLDAMPVPPPLVYMAFHLVNNHCIARTLPAKPVTYPVMIVFGLVQGAFEHLTEDVTSIGFLFTPVLILTFVSLIAFFTCAFQKGRKLHGKSAGLQPSTLARDLR